jgi:hypothetical protein
MLQTAILEKVMCVPLIQIQVLVVVCHIVTLESYHLKPMEVSGLKPVLLDVLPHLRNLFIAVQTVINW